MTVLFRCAPRGRLVSESPSEGVDHQVLELRRPLFLYTTWGQQRAGRGGGVKKNKGGGGVHKKSLWSKKDLDHQKKLRLTNDGPLHMRALTPSESKIQIRCSQGRARKERGAGKA